MMARREQSQFDDAFEDAESDMLTSKAHLMSNQTLFIHRNGHLSSGRDGNCDGTNGELPESDTEKKEVHKEKADEKKTDDLTGHKPRNEDSNKEGMQQAFSEDGQDEYGDTFFIDQSDARLQGISYSVAYQYSEVDDGTREGTEDSGQGQVRDDMTESDKDKGDVIHEHQVFGCDHDDQYEDSGVVDDNGIIDVEGGIQEYEADDHVEGEDRFEEVDIRYDYMEQQSYMQGQTYTETQPYVEDNPAFNESEHDYDHQTFEDKENDYQECTESDLPKFGPSATKFLYADSQADSPFEQTGVIEQNHDYDGSAHSSLTSYPQVTGDYVIVDRDVLAPESNLSYTPSDSVEADQKGHPMSENFHSQNLSSLNKKSEPPHLNQTTNSESRLHEEATLQSNVNDSIMMARMDSKESEVKNVGQPKWMEEKGHIGLTFDNRMSGQIVGQMGMSPKPVVSCAKELRNAIQRRPAPGAAQIVQKTPSMAAVRTAIHSSLEDAPVSQQQMNPPPEGSQQAEECGIGKRISPRPTTQSNKDVLGSQERKTKPDVRGDRPRSMPLPGGAQPVSVLKSRLREELKEMYEIEKNLASTSLQPEVNRIVNIMASSGINNSPGGDGSMSGRHNVEYASVTSLGSSPAQKQRSPTSRAMYNKEPLPNGGMSRTPSSSPEKIRVSKTTQREQQRNNSNANIDLNIVRRPKPNFRAHDHTKIYSYEIEEKSDTDAAAGEIVFDDIAECGAYLDEKDAEPSPIKIKTWKGKSPSKEDDILSGRRRRSYEMANRSSSEDEENDLDACQKNMDREDAGLSVLGAQGGGLLIHGSRGPGRNSSLLSQLAERELANLRNSYKKSQDEAQESLQDVKSVTSDASSTSPTPKERSNKALPKVSPMEYDAVGFRLAGHAGIGESILNLSVSTQLAHPEEDQFSDAEEDENDVVLRLRANLSASGQSYDKAHSSPIYGKRSLQDYKQVTTPSSSAPRHYHQQEELLEERIDVNTAMKELQCALTNNKTKLMKAPSFYTPEQKPIWILQPDAANKYEEDQKRSRILEERKRRNEEMRRSHVQQRAEYMKRTDPQCYVCTEEDEEVEDEDKGLISEQDEKLGAPDHISKQRTSQEQETMRAPDLPPTTGKIKEALGRGIIYPAAYLGSTQLVTTKQPTKKVRMQQAQEAVNRIKSPDGEEQPSTEVDLAISNERIRVLNADTQETMMDHPLKTISYIADIGNIVVIMARRRQISRTLDEAMEESGVMLDADGRRQPRKIICHVFETEDAQLIAQTIGQAFALAYLEFLKANGIDDPHAQEIDYHDVLNSQEIYGDDLMLFSNKECEKEVLIEKERGEIMGMVVVESGWGSLIPTVVIANMSPFGAAARSGKLNIGDQVMSINGTSLVGLPLQQCQQIIKSLKSQCLVKFNVVSCPPVTQVLIKRPDTKYQLGFSVQNGIICSLMRGGIAERGGVRVGHRIIEINGSSVVATAHEKIVEMLSTSVGEIRMKTMPLSMYKLLTGQEQPVYI